MRSTSPEKYSDLKLGDRLCLFYGDGDDAEAIYTAFAQDGFERDEKVSRITPEDILQAGLLQPELWWAYLDQQVAESIDEAFSGLRVFVDAGALFQRWAEGGHLTQNLHSLERCRAKNHCLSIWSIPAASVTSDLLNQLSTTEEIFGLGEKCYLNPHRDIQPTEIPDRGDPTAVMAWMVGWLQSGPPKNRIAAPPSAGPVRDEGRYQSIFTAATLGIVLLDLDGRILECNRAFVEMLGYSPTDIIARSFAVFSHPADVWVDLDMQNLLNVERQPSFQAERRFVRKDGRWVRGRLTASILDETAQKSPAILVFVEDVTTRWQLETELVEVQRRLMQNRELERMRLAQDLHDSLLQELYGLAFSVNDLIVSTNDTELLAHLSGLQASLQEQIRQLRTFCNELRPPTLAPFGLEKAIRSYSENFRSSHPGITIQLDLMSDGQLLPEPVRLALFRIFQETLSNVARHSEADQVIVRLKLEPDQVEMEISDNGQGFEIPDRWVYLARNGHFGLVGAQERADTVGGKMKLWSQPGEGTVVIITVPVNLYTDENNPIEVIKG